MENGFSAPIIQIIINKQIKQTSLHMTYSTLKIHKKSQQSYSVISLIGDKIKYHWAAL